MKERELLNAFSDLTGIPAPTMEYALEYCEKYGIEFDVEALDYEVFQLNSRDGDRDAALLSAIGHLVADKLNADIEKHLGLENFLELSGADGREFWFQYDAEKEKLLREAVQQNPGEPVLLDQITFEQLDQTYDLAEMIVESVAKRGARR